MTETDERMALDREAKEERKFKIRLRLYDRESGASRMVSLDEAKTWNWGDPETWRMVGGWQVTSFQQLLNLLYLKMQKGIEEVEIVEAPRFTMLAGG
jgi:hypothetical protein